MKTSSWPTSLTALLQELIRIPSVNPEGEPGCKETGELAIATYVGKLLEDCGAEVIFSEVLPKRPNVIARFPSSLSVSSSQKKPRLLFAPHLDTVSVSGMTISPFEGKESDGRIWGRGASDTKGSIAAMLWALYKSTECIPHLPWEIWFAGLADEESRQTGSQKLAAETPFDFVIVGEPTDLQVVYQTKGSLGLKLRTKGRAAHSSAPEKGENAILKMLEVLRWIQETAAPQLSQNVYPGLGSSTLNIGMIQGGIRSNIVPDACEVAINVRTVPGQDTNYLRENLHQIWPELEAEMCEHAPLNTSPDHLLIQKLISVGSQLTTAPWVCDATSFAAKGIPAIAIGPGSITQAHTANEFIAIADLEKGTRFFESFLNNLSL